MADDGPSLEAHENVKGGKWHRLKQKILSSHRGSDDDITSSQENDLDAFFRAGRTSSETKRPLGPPLDTSQASKWPTMSKVMSLREGEAADEFPPFRYHKPVRRRGLSVGFVQTRPEIIGEGGDESEEPVVAVARRRKTLGRVETLPSRSPPQVPPHRQMPSHHGSGGTTNEPHISQVAKLPAYEVDQASKHWPQRTPAHSTTSDEQQPLTIREQGDLRWPSPDRRLQPPNTIFNDQITQHSISANVSQAVDPVAMQERLRAPSDAPLLSISKPGTNLERPMRQDSWKAISRMRAEEGKTLVRSGERPATLRPGSSGSESASSRSSSEENLIPRKGVGTDSALNSRDPSPRLESRPGIAASSDPAIFQVPQYPLALLSASNYPAISPDVSQSKAGPSRTDSPQRSDTSVAGPRSTSSRPAISAGEAEIASTAYQAQRQTYPDKYQALSHTLRLPNDMASSSGTSRSPSPGALTADEPSRTVVPKEDKQCSFKCTLNAFRLATSNDTKSSTEPFAHLPQWRSVQVLGLPGIAEHKGDEQPTNLSVLVFDKQSSFADAIIALQHFRLDVQRPSTLQILCSPSHFRKLRVRSGHTDGKLAQTLEEASDVVRSQEFIQNWDFAGTSDLHAFQRAVSGFDVFYDGVAQLLLSTTSHATDLAHQVQSVDARMQVLGKDKRIYTAAFLEDGRALFVELQGHDSIDVAQPKGDLPTVRLVDTHIALAATTSPYGGQCYLPFSMQREAGYKGSVSIAFDDEAAKAAFVAAISASIGSQMTARST